MGSDPDRDVATRASAALAALFIPALVGGLGVALAPRVRVPDALADALAAALASSSALAGLALASRASRGAIAVGLAGVVCLAFVYFAGFSRALLPLQCFALVAVGHAIGASVGRRVAHAGHMLPAAAIASAADVASVFHPSGPSKAIVESEATLPVFALASAVPGTEAVTFVLGVGDLVMMAMFFAVARRHGVSVARVALACAFGLALAFVLSAVLAAPVPALVTLGACVIVAVPAFRDVPQKDRAVSRIAVAVAFAVVIGVVARAALA